MLDHRDSSFPPYPPLPPFSLFHRSHRPLAVPAGFGSSGFIGAGWIRRQKVDSKDKSKLLGIAGVFSQRLSQGLLSLCCVDVDFHVVSYCCRWK